MCPQPHDPERRWTALEHTTALVGDDLRPLSDATILIEAERIAAIGPSHEVHVPANAFRIDARNTHTIPGLCDAHVHFFQSGGLYTRPDAIDLRSVRPYTDEIMYVKTHLSDTFARYLRAGITSVADVGGPFWNYDVRAAAAQNPIAPRVAVAGPLISSVSREILDPLGDPPIVKIDSIEAARALVDRQLAMKTDFVKFWWVIPQDKPAKAFQPIVQTAIDYAHSHGTRVIVHAVELETARLAVESGADILAHSVFDIDVDDAFLELLQKHDVIYTPTLIVVGNYGYTFHRTPYLTTYDLRVANADIVGTLFHMQDVESTLPAPVLEAIRARRAPDPPHAAMRNLKRVHDAGVRIAAGTDAGNIGTQHASSLYHELITMVDSGLSARDVLKTATQGGAALKNRSADLGTIAVGKIADLAILERDPLRDIRAVGAVRDVIKGGVAYKAATLAPDTAQDVVQRQANAFNFHDTEVFAEMYAPNAVMRRDGKVVASSRREIQLYYGQRFKEFPALHSEILSRDVRGSTIIDKQRVTGGRDKPVNATITFSVEGGQISEADIRTTR